jgi:hypothetical protein
VSEENRAVLHRFYHEFFNRGKLDLAEEIIDPDCPLYFGSTSWEPALRLSSKPAP